MAANDYYTEAFTGQAHGIVKVEQNRTEFRRVQAGFAKVPSEEQLKTDSTTSAVATGGPQNYTVSLPYAPDRYVDQMRIGVRFPVANLASPNLAVIGENGNSLGFKPIRQIDGTALTAGHIGENGEALLQYSAVGQGYWTLMAGGRGAPGPAGPPRGTFSVNAMKELVFTPDDGVTAATNLGAVAPLYQGVYAAGTTYSFLDLVREGAYLHLHVGTADTTGVAPSDTSVWQRYSDLPVDGGMLVEFRTATSAADPGDGRMRFNNATPANVTQIYIDDEDANGNDLSDWVDTWDDYGDDPNAQLVIRGTGGNTEALVFNLTHVTALSGYRRLTVSHVAGSSLPGNGDVVSVVPLLRGNTGRDGTNIPDATTTTKGKVELASQAEIDSESGTSAIVPTISGLYRAIARKVKAATTSRAGIIQIATAAQSAAQTDSASAVPPSGLRTPFAALTFAAALTWNVGTHPNATITLTGNVTSLTLSNSQDGGVYTLLIKQDGTGGRTFAAPSTWKWAEGTADSIAAGANDETLLTIRNIDGTIYAAPLVKDLS